MDGKNRPLERQILINPHLDVESQNTGILRDFGIPTIFRPPVLTAEDHSLHRQNRALSPAVNLLT